MPSHMSTLGFQIGSPQDFSDLARWAAKEGKVIELPDGEMYIVWSSGDGIELWTQVDQRGDLIGMNPHFSGDARMQTGLTSRFRRSDDGPLDGAFSGQAGVSGDNPENGLYPFAFDAPDFRVSDGLQLPTVVTVQLAGFAHELKAFADEQALRARGSRMAVESCIPSGTFTPGPGGGIIDPPKSEVIFYGRVLETAQLINAFTHLPFYWTRIRTLGGECDVVADPEVVEGTIVKDGIVGGLFWLSGRLK
jgi:hypothetical protein